MEKKKTSYIDKLAERIEVKSQKVSMYIETFVLGLSADLHAKNQFAFEPFGTFSLKKHLEYIKENEDGSKTLYPPRLEVQFSSSAIAAVLISSTAVELENTYREFFERCDFNEEMATTFISQVKTTLKSLLLQDKFVEIPYLGTFEGELGGELTFVPADYFANLINKPFSYFEPELIVEDCEEEESISNEQEEVSLGDKQATIASLSPIKKEDAISATTELDMENLRDGEQTNNIVNRVVEIPNNNKSEQYLVEQLLKEKEKQILDRDNLLNAKDKDLKYYRRLSLMLIIVLILMIVGFFGLKFYSPSFIEVNSSSGVEDSKSTIVERIEEKNLRSSDQNVIASDSLLNASAEVDTLVKEDVDTLSLIQKESSFDTSAEDNSLKYVYHKLKRGETLREISYKYYKNRDDWTILVNANQDVIKDPNRIPIGEIIRIPKKSQ